MADKSPRQSLSKKSGKSLKEKRSARKAEADVRALPESPTRNKRH